MKVICINNKPSPGYHTTDAHILKEGKVYTVIAEGVNPDLGTENYVLAEVKSSNPIGGFLKARFIPLSTIDETEMERNYADLPSSPSKAD